jgi:hypothetical protein
MAGEHDHVACCKVLGFGEVVGSCKSGAIRYAWLMHSPPVFEASTIAVVLCRARSETGQR